MIHTIQNSFLRIKRILEWIPVLWRTHDWDHGYMTQIWAYSLERLRDSMVNGHCVVTKGKLLKINTAIGLLKRISRDHEYTNLDLDLLIRKYGPLGIPGIDKNTWPKEAIKELIDLSKKDRYLFKQDVLFFYKDIGAASSMLVGLTDVFSMCRSYKTEHVNPGSRKKPGRTCYDLGSTEIGPPLQGSG